MRVCAERATTLRRRRLQVGEHQRIAVGDQPRILHRAIGEVGCGEQVELVVRIRIVEIGFERGDDLRGLAEHVLHALALAAGGDAAQRDRAVAQCGLRDGVEVDQFPRPDRERDQVARQRPRLRVAVLDPAVSQRLGTGFLGVEDRGVALRHADRECPRRLEGGFVEIRERVARTERLHLRHHVVEPAGLDLVGALQALVIGRIESQAQLPATGGDRLRTGDAHGAAAGIDQFGRCGDRGHARADQLHILEGAAAGVDEEVVGRFLDLELDGDGAAVAIGTGIHAQVDGIGRGHDLTRQLAARHIAGVHDTGREDGKTEQQGSEHGGSPGPGDANERADGQT